MLSKEMLKQKPFYLSDADIAWVESTLHGMTDEEKIGQLFCLVNFDSSEEALDKMFAVMQPGGTMFRPFPMAEAVDLHNRLQKRSKIPMLIAANLEKGGNGAVMEGTCIGSQMQVAATDDVTLAGRMGQVCAKEGLAVGVNWSFAPIIDIDYNFRNPITNIRTFGSDPKRVREMGAAYVTELQKYGSAASIKHFPGDGCDERDQHLVTSINDLSCEEWDATYGAAYQASIDAGAKTVMIGHIMQPAYSRHFRPEIQDGDIMPATLAPELMNDLLRGKLGFNGLIVTDATTMAGFTIPMPREKAVPYSIAAGADMFLFTKNLQEDYDAMKKGIEAGVITAERLHDALVRILALKASLGMHKQNAPLTLENAQKAVGLTEYKAWAEESADKSVTLVKEEKGVLPLSASKTPRVLLYPIETSDEMAFFRAPSKTEMFKALLEKEGFKVEVFKVNANGFEGLQGPIGEMLDQYDLFIYLSNLATKSNQTAVRIEWAQPMGANVPQLIQQIPTIFISIANPYHLLDVPRVKTFINCYEASDTVVHALTEKLMGRSAFKGQSPSDAFCGRWDTHL